MPDNTIENFADLVAEVDTLRTNTEASFVGVNNSLTVEKIVKTYNISANAAMAVTFDIYKEEYTPIGIVGFNAGDNSALIVCSEILEDNVTARIVVRNTYSGELSNRTAYLKVLYKKNI